MKKNLHFLLLLCLVLAGTGFIIPAVASHEASFGADLTYSRIGTDSLAIKYRYYRNCGAAMTSSPTVILNYTAPGCHNGGNLTLNRISSVLGQPLCGPAVACQQTPTPNYYEYVYTGKLKLPSACSNWSLSVTNDARLGNNLMMNGASLHTNITLNNTAGLVNTSPVFGTKPVMLVCQNRNVVLQQQATDAEGDSLIYSLVIPMSSATSPVVFAGGATPTAPFGSSVPVMIDQFSGSLTFNPTMQLYNTYALRLKVTEYRRINGTAVNIGETNRDLFVIVTTCPPPSTCMPNLASPLQPVTSVFEIPAGVQTCLDFKVVHTCDSALFIMRYDTVGTPGSFQTIYNGRNIRFCWNPSVGDIRQNPYIVGITLGQNSCPTPESVVRSLNIRVVAGNPTGIAESALNSARLTAYPNPFSQDVTFAVKLKQPGENQELIIYNVLGQEVDRLPVQQLASGENTLHWKPRAKVEAGTYVARLTEAGKQLVVIRFVKIP